MPFNIQITQYSAACVFALTLNLANMPKGIRLCHFSSISINKVKYFNFEKKEKVVLNRVFDMYKVFFPGEIIA